MIVEEEYEDPRKINIPKIEGHREDKGLQIENPDITVSLKTKQVNIGTEVELKFAKIGDYWDNTMVDKVPKFLYKYQDIFTTKIIYLKGIINDPSMMKITLKPDVKPVKKRPYRLNLKYNEKVCLEVEKMLATCIIEPMEEPHWVSPMVIQE